MRQTKCDTCGGSGAVDNADYINQNYPADEPDRLPVRTVQCDDCNGTGKNLSSGIERHVRHHHKYAGD